MEVEKIIITISRSGMGDYKYSIKFYECEAGRGAIPTETEALSEALEEISNHFKLK
jgi:hypothetical protein